MTNKQIGFGPKPKIIRTSPPTNTFCFACNTFESGIGCACGELEATGGQGVGRFEPKVN